MESHDNHVEYLTNLVREFVIIFEIFVVTREGRKWGCQVVGSICFEMI